MCPVTVVMMEMAVTGVVVLTGTLQELPGR